MGTGNRISVGQAARDLAGFDPIMAPLAATQGPPSSPQPPIDQAMTRVQQEIEALSCCMDELAGKLQPIIANVPETKADTNGHSAMPPGASPIATQLHSMANKLKVLRENLQTMYHRIEV